MDDLPSEFVLVCWDYGKEDPAEIVKQLRGAIPNLLKEFRCCATAAATEADYFTCRSRLHAIGDHYPTFSYAVTWVNRTVDCEISAKT